MKKTEIAPRWALILGSVVGGITILVASMLIYGSLFGLWKDNDPKYRTETETKVYKPEKSKTTKDDSISQPSKISKEQIMGIDWNKFQTDTHTVSVPLETGAYNGANEKIEYNFDIQVPNFWTDLQKPGLNQYQFTTEGSKGDTVVDIWSMPTYYDNGERDFGFHTAKEELDIFLKSQNVNTTIYEKEINGKKVNFSMVRVPKYNQSVISYAMGVTKDGTPSVIIFNVINFIDAPVSGQLTTLEQVENLISKVDLPQS